MIRAALPLLTLATLACEPGKVGGLAAPKPNAVEVTVDTEPPGAAVIIDGTPVGPAPQTVRLNPGPHALKATKSGYFPAEQRLTVSSGEPLGLKLTLVASH